jgi:hypothetical protein
MSAPEFLTPEVCETFNQWKCKARPKSQFNKQSPDASLLAVPSLAEQRDIIKLLEQNNPRTIGMNAFLISVPWLRQWQTDVCWMRKIAKTDVVSCCALGNTHLLRDGDCDWEHKNEFMDCAILVEAIWNQFALWYGGGPPIPVPIRSSRFGRPIVAWRELRVVLRYGDTVKRYLADRFCPIGAIQDAAIDIFGISN